MIFGSRRISTISNYINSNDMKKLFLAVLTISMLMGTNASAQGKFGADSAECIKYLSYYKEYYKQKSYDDATPSWRKAYTLCPATASQNLYIEGATLVKRLISKNASNTEYRNALIDTLIDLYKTRAANYPKYAVTALNNMGTDVNNYVKNNPQKSFDIYEEIIAANGKDTKATVLLFDLDAAINLYQEGKLDTEKIIEIYQRNNEILDGVVAENDSEKEQNENVKNDLGSLFASSKVADCETLIELYSPRLEADPENLQLASSIVKTMSIAGDCNDNDLFLKAVTTMDKLDPSASSAYYLFRLHSAKGNVGEAITYLEKAIASDETDAAKDAEYTYELAMFCFKNGQNAKAYEYAGNVASMSEELAGKAYFLIANIWASVRCGGDEISSRAPYWVACDYMAKAKNADPSLAEEANRYIGQYSVYFPQTAEAFMYDIQNGQSYTVSCGGMRATTTVRTNSK